MEKVLAILPVSIAGTLIVKGFSAGFKANGCYVMEKDVRELCPQDLERYKPGIIFCYDYGYMHNKELFDYILAHKNNYRLVHYFADEPDGRYAYTDFPELYKNFKEIKGVYSFVWDKEFCRHLEGSIYLPLGVNPKAYRTDAFGQYRYSITFAGRPLTEKRQKLLCSLIREFGRKVNIFSYEPHFLRSVEEIKSQKLLDDYELEIYKNSYKGFLQNEKELADVYNASKININITLQGETSLNYRVFEVLASKAFLITDDVADLKDNFRVGKELEVYGDEYDLIDKVKFYLKNPYILQNIAENGYAAILQRHSYAARANIILQSIKK